MEDLPGRGGPFFATSFAAGKVTGRLEGEPGPSDKGRGILHLGKDTGKGG